MEKLQDESLSLTSLSRKWARRILFWLIGGVAAGVIAAIIVGIVSSGPGETGICEDPEIRINFPVEGQPVQEVVELVGRFECIPESRRLWITVTPKLGTPHGIHTVVVDTQARTFSATAVLSSGPGEYRICAVLADKDAGQAFQGAIEQEPPVGLAELPPTALLVSCRITIVP